MKNVSIIEKRTQRVVATIPVQMQGSNYTPDRREYEALAWKCAVSDNSVDPLRKEDYLFEVLEVSPPAAPKSWS